jgi:threonine dehydrogenase-like Zn-dependent dehydrogenase
VRAARLHKPGTPLKIDEIEVPEPRLGDALVQVKACSLIPAMEAIVQGTRWHLPPLPAILGLDATGVVVKAPSDREDISEGDRVYINPLLSCGNCAYCRNGSITLCSRAAFRGYFSWSAEGVALLKRYPYGGLCEYVTASPESLVKLPTEVSFDQGTRFGYLGTSFAALRMGGVGAGSWIAINGITGTLGVGAVLLALGMGVTRILGWGRNRSILKQLKDICPTRIDTLAMGDSPIKDWLLAHTDGLGVDLLLDCSGRGAPAGPVVEGMEALKYGATAVNVGALGEPLGLNPVQYMVHRKQYRGSMWFTTSEAELMADMARTGVLDLSHLVPQTYPLARVNEALADVSARPGGFTNVVVRPCD